MNLSERINAFSNLGERLQSLTLSEKETLKDFAKAENPWFTSPNIDLALLGIGRFLTHDALVRWTDSYALENISPKRIGVAMAGNIPMVGFHDLLCVLMAGHTLHAKRSHLDTCLMNWISHLLVDIEPRFESKILYTERLTHIEAVIATGSDNTSRYFEYYFRDIPHIIRKNRSSCAVILGEESIVELQELAIDLFSYFGLGCRNISKLYVPECYDFSALLTACETYSFVRHHHKYMNNYEYQKTILALNNIPFWDSGFLLLKEDPSMVSPISIIFYEHYIDQVDLKEKLDLNKPKIQCVSSAKGWYESSVAFGKTQFPEANDYADGVDTLLFLSRL